MKLFLFAEDTPAAQRTMARLSHGGYSTELLGQRQWAGTPHERLVRRKRMECIMRADAVVVPDDADMALVARLAVVCEFAGKPLLKVGDLPRWAPTELKDLLPFAIHAAVRCTWTTLPVGHDLRDDNTIHFPTGERVRQRIRSAVKAAAYMVRGLYDAANEHIGEHLKNPMTRSTRAEHPG